MEADTELIKNISRSLSLKNVANVNSKSVNLRRYGHIVILDFYGICPQTIPSGQDVVIADGLPKPIAYAVTMLVPNPGSDADGGLRIGVNNNGQLVYWWVMSGINLNAAYNGQLMYFTND